jgi:cell division septum initiation protein DivIVA
MTKQRELEILDQAIAHLGPDSYLGPWLSGARLDIATDIGNDFPICADFPRQARKEAQRILADATHEYVITINEAEVKAREIIRKATDAADAIRDDAQRMKERAAAELERYAHALTR